MSYENSILILFVVASFVSIIIRYINLPYTIALMAVGLALGSVNIIHPPELTQELLYSIFLPPLIFGTAIHMKIDDFKKDFFSIVTLVIPGVILATFVTAFILVKSMSMFHVLDTHIQIGWPIAILFGAAVAATDPIAVVSLFEKLGVPKRLSFLVDSESLLNDGTAIVVFIIALSLLQGDENSIQNSIVEFFKIAGFGLLIGFVVGLLADNVLKYIDDSMVVITITTVVAYGSFLIADSMGFSGVMSTVAAGLVLGEKSLSKTPFPAIRFSVENFWNYVMFAFNSLIFLLMGFEINLALLWQLWPIIVLAYTAVLLARFLVVNATWGLFFATKYRFPLSWAVVMSWGGLRGALSMVLALSIPHHFEFRELLIALVFGVVFLSIFIQGLSMPFVLQTLKLVSSVNEIKEYEQLDTKIELFNNSLEKIDKLQAGHRISKKIADTLRAKIQEELDQLNRQLQQIETSEDVIFEEKMLKTKREILMSQIQSLIDMYHNGAITFDAFRALRADFDIKLLELENNAD